jgi:hypothetical protein
VARRKIAPSGVRAVPSGRRGGQGVGEQSVSLVVRELICGSRRFKVSRRDVPRMSPSLLWPRPKPWS